MLFAAKNVVLAGVRAVTIWDSSKVQSADLASQFYFSETDIGKNRGEACRDSLQELNAAVTVSSSQEDLSKSMLGKFEVNTTHTMHAISNVTSLCVVLF